MPRSDRRFHVTVYACISENALTGPVIYLSDRTINQVEFRKFLLKVKQNVKSTVTTKPFIVIDGHSSHKTAATVKVIDEHFKSVMTPAHSSPFNVSNLDFIYFFVY